MPTDGVVEPVLVALTAMSTGLLVAAPGTPTAAAVRPADTALEYVTVIVSVPAVSTVADVAVNIADPYAAVDVLEARV